MADLIKPRREHGVDGFLTPIPHVLMGFTQDDKLHVIVPVVIGQGWLVASCTKCGAAIWTLF